MRMALLLMMTVVVAVQRGDCLAAGGTWRAGLCLRAVPGTILLTMAAAAAPWKILPAAEGTWEPGTALREVPKRMLPTAVVVEGA